MMPKNIHTPRDELICGAIDRAEDFVRSGDMVNLMYELVTIRQQAERMEAKLVSRKDEAGKMAKGIATPIVRIGYVKGHYEDGLQAEIIEKSSVHEGMELFAVQPVMAGTEDHDEAVRLLGLVFDAWENGDSCTEDGEPDGAYMGQCFQLDTETFDACCNLLNRLNPPRNVAPIAPVTEREAARYRGLRHRCVHIDASVPGMLQLKFVTDAVEGMGHLDEAVDTLLAATTPPEATKGGA